MLPKMIFPVENSRLLIFLVALLVTVFFEVFRRRLRSQAVGTGLHTSMVIGDCRTKRATNELLQRNVKRLLVPGPVVFGLECVGAKCALIYSLGGVILGILQTRLWSSAATATVFLPIETTSEG